MIFKKRRVSVRVVTDISNLRLKNRPVVAIGVFDGVHKAHRLIIDSAVRLARRRKTESVVLTFWPHPQAQASLISLAHRLRLIESLKVDIVVVVRFDRSLAGMSGEDFVSKVLVKRLNAGAIFIGENFRFGKEARQDVDTLKSFSRTYDFTVRSFPVLCSGGKPVSSTLIRKLISRGKLRSAEKLLLRPVSVLGTVVKGSSLASKLGFPTANIAAHHEVLPPPGIYAVEVSLAADKFPGACYIGKRPTFFRDEQSIEVHIFDFKRNIYGQDLEIDFIRKVREDRKFPDARALIKQIKKDIAKVKNILSRRKISL